MMQKYETPLLIKDFETRDFFKPYKERDKMRKKH